MLQTLPGFRKRETSDGAPLNGASLRFTVACRRRAHFLWRGHALLVSKWQPGATGLSLPADARAESLAVAARSTRRGGAVPSARRPAGRSSHF